MDAKKPELKKLSMSSTKQEMLDAYNMVLKQLQEKEQNELKPEKKMEEKRQKEVAQVAQDLLSDGVMRDIANLRMELAKTLADLSDKLDAEIGKFKKIQEAVEFKRKELEELYGIEKAAMSLAALIEAQNRKQQEFEERMTEKNEQLTRDIETTRARWDEEKKTRQAQSSEWEAAEKKRREREREEFEYGFKREQKITIEALQDEKSRLEKEIASKKAELETLFSAREKALAEKEAEFDALREQANKFPKEMEAAVVKAVKEATERGNQETKARVELLQKEFDGERNVLKTRIESFEKTVKDQHEQIAKLSQQLEKAYQKIEDVAVKTIEGAASVKSFSQLQQLLTDQVRRQGQEK